MAFLLVESLRNIRNLYKFTVDDYFHYGIIYGDTSLENMYMLKVIYNINNYHYCSVK